MSCSTLNPVSFSGSLDFGLSINDVMQEVGGRVRQGFTFRSA